MFEYLTHSPYLRRACLSRQSDKAIPLKMHMTDGLDAFFCVEYYLKSENCILILVVFV